VVAEAEEAELPIPMMDVTLLLGYLTFGLEELIVEDYLRFLPERSQLGWEHYQELPNRVESR